MKRVFTPTKKKTILMLDDDQPVGQGYREELEAHGFKVYVASAFDTAMQALRSTAVDVAIFDLCLPGINVVELIKNIRSDSAILSTPIVAFSNPYLGSLAEIAAEAGATKSIAKIDTTPERLLEMIREFGLSPSPKGGGRNAVEALKGNQQKPSPNPLVNRSQTLAKFRASYQNFTRTEREDLRRSALLQMHRQLRLLAGSDNTLAFGKIVRLSTALEALFVELYMEPAKITASVVRTIAHSIEILASLLDRAASPQEEKIPSAKVLVVDDEVIARQLICSAVAKANLEAVGLDDPLAARRCVKRERFDLIFLDVEMPGLTGIELCVEVRATEWNRNTPIVFVTSHSDFGSRAQSALSGGNDFIAKPFLLVEVALKALNWLFKDNAQPTPPARLPERVAANINDEKRRLATPAAPLSCRAHRQ